MHTLKYHRNVIICEEIDKEFLKTFLPPSLSSSGLPRILSLSNQLELDNKELCKLVMQLPVNSFKAEELSEGDQLTQTELDVINCSSAL